MSTDLLRRLLCWLGSLDLIVVPALSAILLVPRPKAGLALLAIPILWLCRRVSRGSFSVATRYDNSIVCLLALLPLALLPVTDWARALPKLYGILLGVALIYALVNALPTLLRAIGAAYAVVLLLGLGFIVLGAFGTALPANKFLALGAIRDRLPLLAHGLVHGTTGGAINPDEMGGAITFVLPATLAALIGALSTCQRRRLWLAGALALTTLGLAFVLLLTQSRSAYAGAAVGTALVIAWWLSLARATARGRVFGSIIVLTLAAGGIVAAGHALHHGLAALPPSTKQSLLGRLELWERGLDMIQDFPFTGVGLAQFQPVMRTLYSPFLNDPSADLPHVHDFFLQLALDLGIPGAVNIAFLFGYFFLNVYRVHSQHADLEIRSLSLGLGCGVIAFLTYGLTDAITLGAIGGMGLWAFFGLAAALAPPAARANAGDGT